MTTKARSEEPKAPEPVAAPAKADEVKTGEKPAAASGGVGRGGATVGGGETSTTTVGGKTTTKAERTPEEAVAQPSTCVVDDGTRHTGNATPGAKVCSAHAMHYLPDGKPREENRPIQPGREEVRR